MFAQLLGFSFGFGPTSVCRSPEGICFLLKQEGVKGGSGSLRPVGREWHRMRGEPVATEADMTLQQPKLCRVFSRGKFSLDHRTLAVVGCTGSREGSCG